MSHDGTHISSSWSRFVTCERGAHLQQFFCEGDRLNLGILAWNMLVQIKTVGFFLIFHIPNWFRIRTESNLWRVVFLSNNACNSCSLQLVSPHWLWSSWDCILVKSIFSFSFDPMFNSGQQETIWLPLNDNRTGWTMLAFGQALDLENFRDCFFRSLFLFAWSG